MPAPSLAILLDFETQMDAALVATIAPAVGPSVSVVPYHSYTEAKIPRVECLFTIGRQTGPQGVTLSRNATLPMTAAAYTGTFDFNIYVRRTEDQSDAPIGAAIQEALNPQTSLLNSNLSYLQVVALDFAGSVRQINREERWDMRTIRYEITFTILQSAWPV